MGRSATTPRQGELASFVTIVATESPPSELALLRSAFTDSVRRLACSTVTCLVMGAPLCKRYWILTTQSLVGSGLPRVRYSTNPPPTRPSAKYHVLAVGPGG